MTWEQAQLTTKEAEKALEKARLPVDPCEWSIEQFQLATDVLEKAQREKISNSISNSRPNRD